MHVFSHHARTLASPYPAPGHTPIRRVEPPRFPGLGRLLLGPLGVFGAAGGGATPGSSLVGSEGGRSVSEGGGLHPLTTQRVMSTQNATYRAKWLADVLDSILVGNARAPANMRSVVAALKLATVRPPKDAAPRDRGQPLDSHMNLGYWDASRNAATSPHAIHRLRRRLM